MTKELKTNNRSAAAEKTRSLLPCREGLWQPVPEEGGRKGGGVRGGGGVGAEHCGMTLRLSAFSLCFSN